jgi:hypothetical protein
MTISTLSSTKILTSNFTIQTNSLEFIESISPGNPSSTLTSKTTIDIDTDRDLTTEIFKLSNSTTTLKLNDSITPLTAHLNITETILSSTKNAITTNLTVQLTSKELVSTSFTEYLTNSIAGTASTTKITETKPIKNTTDFQNISYSTSINTFTTTKEILTAEEINKICLSAKVLNDSFDISKGCYNKCRDSRYNETHSEWIGFLSNVSFPNIFPLNDSCLINLLWEKEGNF